MRNISGFICFTFTRLLNKVILMEFDNVKTKNLIIEKGLRLKWIAEKLGVSDRSLQAWLIGKTKPKKPTVMALAQVLGVRAEDLLMEKKES